MKIYGLPNCDTTKAASKWLKQNAIDFAFHDVKSGVSKEELQGFLAKLPLEKLLNKKSTTWRGLTAEEQASAASVDGAIALIQANTSLLKRPVAIWPNGDITAGWDEKMFVEKAGKR